MPGVQPPRVAGHSAPQSEPAPEVKPVPAPEVKPIAPIEKKKDK